MALWPARLANPRGRGANGSRLCQLPNRCWLQKSGSLEAGGVDQLRTTVPADTTLTADVPQLLATQRNQLHGAYRCTGMPVRVSGHGDWCMCTCGVPCTETRSKGHCHLSLSLSLSISLSLHLPLPLSLSDRSVSGYAS
jgi:hypothetical protein